MKKIAAIALRHWKFLAVFNLFVIAATAAKIVTYDPIWTANGQMILPDSSSSLDASLGTLGSYRAGDLAFSSSVNPLKVQISILTSDALMERVWERDPEKENFSSVDSYKYLFNFSPKEQSTIIWFSVTAPTPEIAKERSLILIDEYQKRLNQLRKADSSARTQFSQKELNQAQQRLQQAQNDLAEFQKASGLVSSEAQTSEIVGNISQLATAKSQAEAQAEASQSKVQALSSRLEMMPQQAVRSLGLSENPDYLAVRNQLTQLDSQLAETRVIFTDASPVVQTLLEKREALREQLQKYVAQAATETNIDPSVSSGAEGRAALIQELILAESEAEAERQRAKELETKIASLNQDLKAIPEGQARLQELRRQYEVAEGIYKGLVAQVQQVNLDAFDAYPNVQVLDPPTVDPYPDGPKVKLAAIAAFMASLVGSIALALLLEGRNPLLSPNDLQDVKFPIVVRIPELKHPRIKLETSTETELEFQRLASAISLQPLNNRRLIITSAIVDEGKTTIIVGLASALVDLGFRVLLVDGDFRLATLSRRLGYAEPTTEEPIQLHPRLDLLPTKPQKGKIIEQVTRGGKFEQTLSTAQAQSEYDYILVDSAPVSLTSETALMVNYIPNVLFVVRPGISKRNAVNDSLDQLKQHNAQLLALVVNGAETQSRQYAYRQGNSLT
ncbi:MAG: GNVR domain-containing protein [Oscillatoria sp. PMC 1068.18]|nr:GNVR domain-containing protein [Oscillatoria sp. PMC 1076.18]MEC4987683.1 GNVR domain-containing protein [Oscillatoria sp. PMC 1068.18]